LNINFVVLGYILTLAMMIKARQIAVKQEKYYRS